MISDYRNAQKQYVVCLVAWQRAKRREETNPDKYLIHLQKASIAFQEAEKQYDYWIREFDSNNEMKEIAW